MQTDNKLVKEILVPLLGKDLRIVKITLIEALALKVCMLKFTDQNEAAEQYERLLIWLYTHGTKPS